MIIPKQVKSKKIDTVRFVKFLSIFVLAMFFAQNAMSQKLPKVEVRENLAIKPFLIQGLSKIVDRKITFRLTNVTKERIVVYGSNVEGKLFPIRYRLTYNKNTEVWDYPNRDNKPTDWKGVSSLNKQQELLNPRDFLEFSSYFSTASDCGFRYKITVQVKIGKSRKSQEIISDEILLDCEQEIIETSRE